MKNHRAPQGLKEKEEGKKKKKENPVKAGLGTFLSVSIETISPAERPEKHYRELQKYDNLE